MSQDIKRTEFDIFNTLFQLFKILVPHVILVAVLIGYLCLGAWVLMILETKTELVARSRKLIRLSNMMTNFTTDSWRMLNEAQLGVRSINRAEWATIFR